MATTLDMLLAALNREGLPPVPDPAASMPLPVRTAGPTPGPTLGAPPEAAPIAPLPAADTNFVNQFAGPAPVRPVAQQPSFLDKLSTVLLGVSSGLQGRAPQFIESVREERLRPIREYEAALERFQNRRTQGLEIDTRRREREQDRATRTAEAKAERDFQEFVRKGRLTDELALQQARQAFDLQRLREQERAADERQAAQLAATQERQRREIENKLASEDGAPPSIAKEISEYQVGIRPELSTAAQKWRGARARKLEAQLARMGGGGGQVMAVLQGGQVIPASLVDRQSGGVMLNGTLVPVVQYIGGNIPAPARNQQDLMPGEPGGPQGPPTPRTETLAGGIRMTTPGPNIKRSAAKAKLVKGGYSSKEADQELDRLGIQ